MAIASITDHAVTHSVYISDPDGNEIELYVDVPGVDWGAHPELINSATPLQLSARPWRAPRSLEIIEGTHVATSSSAAARGSPPRG